MQLNFKYDVSAEDYTGAVDPLAEQFAAVPGLRWKIWMINADKSEAGGIYMFEDGKRSAVFPRERPGRRSHQPPCAPRFQRETLCGDAQTDRRHTRAGRTCSRGRLKPYGESGEIRSLASLY